MRCRAAVTLVVLSLGLPACAQRGGARGSFAAHGGAAPSFPSRSMAFPQGFAPHSVAASHLQGSRLQGTNGRYPFSMAQRPTFFTRTRSPFGPGPYAAGPYAPQDRDSRANHIIHRPSLGNNGAYGHRLPYPPLVIGVIGVTDPYASGDTIANGYPNTFPSPFGDDTPAPTIADPAAAAPQDASEYAGTPADVPSADAAEPPPAPDAVTILFKDGRPPLRVRNYALTRSALYLTGQHFYEIPLSDIDLPATQRLNWNAGVAFRLPDAH